MAGKYLAGLAVALVLFVGSVAASFLLIGRHFGPAWTDYLLHGPGLQPARLRTCWWRRWPASDTARYS